MQEFADRAELAERFPGAAERQAQFGGEALVTLPLVAHGEVLGSLMLVYRVSQPFDNTERAFVAAFAEQAAHALRRATAYEHEQATAEELQRSLLPDSLPEVSGLAFGARYEPAGLGVDVGGDWFDVLPLPDGSVVVAIGDVMGRGLAAATIMGQMLLEAGRSETADDRAVLVVASTVGRDVRSATATFPATPEAVPEARRFLAAVLEEWGLPEETRDDAVLCLSETVSNAVIHTATSPRVTASLDGSRLIVSVADQGRRGTARLVDTPPDELGGRGLALVSAVTTTWNAERRSDGTIVWFELDVDGRG